MKTTSLLISMLFIIQFTYSQYTIDITDYSKLNKSQLQVALDQAEQDINTGQTLTVVGSVGFVGGMIGMFAGSGTMGNTNYQKGLSAYGAGSIIMSLSAIPLTWGIYKLWKGNADKSKIKMHLMKFQSSNVYPEPAYGAQLTFRF